MDLILWGGKGHAKVLADAVGTSRRIVAVFDADPSLPSPLPGVPILCGREGFERWLAERGGAPCEFLVAIGGERGPDRLELHDYLAAHGLTPGVAVHPRAFVAPSAKLGEGCQVLAQAALCVEASLGRQCIVNTGATVDHECQLDDGVHIAPGAHLAGLVTVGACAMVGTGASVLPRVRIGEAAIVGAGAVVTHDVPDRTVVVGNPARAIRTRA